MRLDSRLPRKNIKEKEKRMEVTQINHNSTTDKRTMNGMKIGQFVQYNMRKLHEQNLISDKEIENLQDRFYSKQVLDQTFEILRSSDKEIRGEDGRNRYYAREKFCGDYHLTSQWVERHWEPFLSWMRKIYVVENIYH